MLMDHHAPVLVSVPPNISATNFIFMKLGMNTIPNEYERLLYLLI